MRVLTRMSLLAVACLWSTAAVRAAAPDAAEAWEPAGATEIRLANGLLVWVVISPDAEGPNLGVVVREPPEAESPRLAGLAWLAHGLLSFPGRGRVDDAVRQDVVLTPGFRAGWADLNLNLYSDGAISRVARAISDWMVNPPNRKRTFDHSREEVEKRLAREAGGDEVRTRVSELADTLLYGTRDPWPYRYYGSPATVRRIRGRHARRYLRDTLHAGNVGVVVSSRLDAGAVVAAIAGSFECLPPAPADAPRFPTPPVPPAVTRLGFIETDSLAGARILVTGLGPPLGHKERAAVRVAAYRVGELANGWSDPMRLDAMGRFWSHADTTPTAVVQRVREVLGWFAGTAQVPDEDVARYKARLIEGERLAYMNTGTRAWGYLPWLAMGASPVARRDEIISLRAVTADEVRKAAKWWLSPDHLAVVVAGPRRAVADDGRGVDVRAELAALHLQGP